MEGKGSDQNFPHGNDEYSYYLMELNSKTVHTIGDRVMTSTLLALNTHHFDPS